ncbi:Transmembrane protein 53 [Allomyces arbusculus]|nr:Transmembrane protein 53 [Allomyces arbusculus]
MDTDIDAAARSPTPKNDAEEAAADVVLLGWADGDIRYVSKYLCIYAKELREWSTAAKNGGHSDQRPIKWAEFAIGSKTVQLLRSFASSHADIEPLYHFLLDGGHLHPEDEAAVLADPSTPSRPLVFHIFSNGGVNTLAILLDLVRHQHMRLTNVCALLLDSCPTPISSMAAWGGAGVYTDMLLPPKYTPRLVRTVVQGIMYGAMHLSHAITVGIFKCTPRLDANFETLVAHPALRSVPRLLLFSQGDTLVSAESVRLAAQKMREAGYAEMVEEHDFGDSLHVQHYRKYPAEYVRVVGEFLRRAGVAGKVGAARGKQV